MDKFIKKNWILILVLLYFVAPDLIPGPVDDTALLLAEVLRRFIASKQNKEEKK
jgi:uncharacterized membrane protein YkvA (DUF1232 family)